MAVRRRRRVSTGGLAGPSNGVGVAVAATSRGGPSRGGGRDDLCRAEVPEQFRNGDGDQPEFVGSAVAGSLQGDSHGEKGHRRAG